MLLGRRGEVDASILELAERFAEGLAAYRQRVWSDAEAAFKRCQEITPEDGPSHAFLQRIAKLSDQTLPDDWNGVWRLAEK